MPLFWAILNYHSSILFNFHHARLNSVIIFLKNVCLFVMTGQKKLCDNTGPNNYCKKD